MTDSIRSFRPKFANLVPGIGSSIDGCYWFDGVEVHVKLNIKMASTATYPMGSNPAIYTPSEIELLGSWDTISDIGDGQAHDLASGKAYPLVVAIRDSMSVILYVDANPYGGITNSTPFVWGPNAVIRVAFSYIPKVRELPKNFGAYGDSIVRFETNSVPTDTWPNKVPVDGLTFGGGYAIDGGTSIQVLAGAKELDLDVAVCAVGVNDVYQQATYGTIPLATTLAKITALEAKVKADNFILCKVSPYDLYPTQTATMNAALETLAGDNGWTLIDPFGAYRAVGGGWISGASYDGTHPNTPAATAAATVIRTAILGL